MSVRSILVRAVALACVTAVAATTVGAADAVATPVKPTIVLVHGAWADGSSWSAVTANLVNAGYTVDVVPNPLRGVKSDADYLKRFLGTVSGPIVLVGHSYGGMVVTNAATGNPNIQALVYVDAYIPARGETVNGLSNGSALNDQSVFSAVPLDSSNTVFDLYIKQNLFPGLFAAGAPASVTSVLAAGQRPLTTSALGEASPYPPAWKTIPSYAIVGTSDKIIPPANLTFMANRAGAHVVKVRAPHLSMVTDPTDVTALITTAATAG